MEGKGFLEESLKQAFEAHEAPVRPELWSGIQAQVAANAAASSAAASSASASAIFGNAATVVGIAGLMTVATISEVRIQSSASESVVPAVEETVSSPAPRVIDAVEEPVTEATSEATVAFEEVIEEVAQTEAVELATSDEGSAMEPEVSNTAASSDEENVPSDQPLPQDTEVAHNSQTSAQRPAESSAQQPASQPSQQVNAAPQPAKDEAAVKAPEQTEPQYSAPEPERTEEQAERKSVAYFPHEAMQPLTPNGDGHNDYFEVDAQNVDKFSIRIFTRGAEIVFESDDPDFRWDGRDKMGNLVPAGTYYYEIIAIGTDGIPYRERNAKGALSVY